MKQLTFEKVNGWGGKRKGAGRKNRSGQVSHGKRESIGPQNPLHITLKLKPRTAHLRTRALFKEFRASVARAKSFGLRVIHYSVQNDHIHIFAEANNGEALGRGMKCLGSKFGKAVRRAIGAAGGVFNGRYHVHILKTPTEVKRALRYVLLNFSKHAGLVEYIDEFTSGNAFKEWRRLLGKKINQMLASCIEESWRFKHPELTEPRSWLAREGWRRAA